MKPILVLLIAVVALTFMVLGIGIAGQRGGPTGQFVAEGTIGMQVIIIVCAIFVAYRILQRQIVQY